MADNLHSHIWESYTACWSNPDEANRKELLSQLLTNDCTYTDPNLIAVGIDNLSNYMAQFQNGNAGAKFITTDFKVHHDQSLTHWNMVNSKGTILSKGASFGVYKDGRLCKITGFFWGA